MARDSGPTGSKRPRKEKGGSSTGQSSNTAADNGIDMIWLSNAKVIPGRFVICESIKEYDVQEAFDSIEWGNILNLQETVYPNLVKKFVEFMRISEDTSEIRSTVKGKNVVMSLETLSTVLGIPNDGEKVFYWPNGHFGKDEDGGMDFWVLNEICLEEGRTSCQDHDLKPKQKVWNKVLISNVFPRAGNTNRIFPFQGYTLYCLTIGILLNLNFIIFRYFLDSVNKKRNLPYGMIFTRLFKHFKVNLAGELTEQPTTALSQHTLGRMTFGRAEAAQAQGAGGDGAGGSGAGGSGAGASGVGGAGIDESTWEHIYDHMQELDINAHERHTAFEQRLNTRMSGLEASQTRMEYCIGTIQANQASMIQSLLTIQEMLQNHGFPPPPPPPPPQ